MIVGQIVDKLPSSHLRRSHPSLLDSETLLGVEVEVEGCTKALPSGKTESGYWTGKEDNSLRAGGREFVFSEPLFGADVIVAVDFLCDEALKQKWIISERTGIHVHMDMREVELDKFQNFCILYALTEPLIYNWIGDSRDKNIHCLPWYMADADVDNIGEIFRQPKTAQSIIKNIHRYSGLNLASLLTFGTAEFRHLKTTFDKKRILDWMNIILSLKKAALAWQGTPKQLIPEMRLLGPFGFGNKVFGEYIHKMWYPKFAKDFIGLSLPVAEHLTSLTHTKVEPLKRIERHMSLESDESGDNPGFVRFKQRKGPQVVKSGGKKIKTPFGELELDAASYAVHQFIQEVAPGQTVPVAPSNLSLYKKLYTQAGAWDISSANGVVMVKASPPPVVDSTEEQL